MAKPLLGIMALYLNGNKLEERSLFRKFTTAGRKLGMDVFAFTPEDVLTGERRIRGHFYDTERGVWVRRITRFPDVVFDRCRYQANVRFAQLRKFRERYPDLNYMNRPMRNKWAIHQLLSKDSAVSGYLPATRIYTKPSDLSDFLKGRELVYLKPKNGTGGRGILRISRAGDGLWLIQGRNQARRIIPPQRVTTAALASRLSGWKLTNRYLIQQGIDLRLPSGRVHDYRLLMQKDGSGKWAVTGCAGRVGAARSVTSNLHGGGHAISMDRLLRLRFPGSSAKVESVRESVHTLGFDVIATLERQFPEMCELALDVAVDRSGRPWLLEINPKPAREVFHRIGERETYRRAIERPLEYALHLHRTRGDGGTNEG